MQGVSYIWDIFVEKYLYPTVCQVLSLFSRNCFISVSQHLFLKSCWHIKPYEMCLEKLATSMRKTALVHCSSSDKEQTNEENNSSDLAEWSSKLDNLLSHPWCECKRLRCIKHGKGRHTLGWCGWCSRKEIPPWVGIRMNWGEY